jgi:hypothetical protein
MDCGNDTEFVAVTQAWEPKEGVPPVKYENEHVDRDGFVSTRNHSVLPLAIPSGFSLWSLLLACGILLLRRLPRLIWLTASAAIIAAAMHASRLIEAVTQSTTVTR